MPKTQVTDLQDFPLVAMTLPSTVNMGYADVLEHDTRAVFSLRRRYVSITDSRAVIGMPDAKTRKRMGEWARSHEDDFRRWQVANVIVVNSVLVRAGLSAVHWLAPPPVPTLVATDWETGLVFLHKHALEQGVDTAGLRAFAERQRIQLAAS